MLSPSPVRTPVTRTVGTFTAGAQAAASTASRIGSRRLHRGTGGRLSKLSRTGYSSLLRAVHAPLPLFE